MTERRGRLCLTPTKELVSLIALRERARGAAILGGRQAVGLGPARRALPSAPAFWSPRTSYSCTEAKCCASFTQNAATEESSCSSRRCTAFFHWRAAMAASMAFREQLRERRTSNHSNPTFLAASTLNGWFHLS